MDDVVMLAPVLAAVALFAVSRGSAAQALADPTRPPLELMQPAASGAPARTPLQSILLSSTRKGAILNGQYVPLGGTYGKATLVKITETEVTLKSDEGQEVLQLYPLSGKTPPPAQSKPEKAVKRP